MRLPADPVPTPFASPSPKVPKNISTPAPHTPPLSYVATDCMQLHATWDKLLVDMLKQVLAAGVLLAAASGGLFADQAYRAVLDQYCVTCHNRRLKTGGLTLDNADLAKVPAQAQVWEKVIRKLRSGTMPPAGLPRPDAATYASLAAWLETQIDQGSQPYAGRPILHRLNRAEYANAVRDLLALDIDVASLLPPDDSAYGFDNISDALGVSPSLQERYLDAALKIGALAVGDPKIPAGSETWRIRQDLSQDQHVNGLPLGTIGGTSVRYNFPLDGEYSFQAKLYRTNLNIMRGLEVGSSRVDLQACKLEYSIVSPK